MKPFRDDELPDFESKGLSLLSEIKMKVVEFARLEDIFKDEFRPRLTLETAKVLVPVGEDTFALARV